MEGDRRYCCGRQYVIRSCLPKNGRRPRCAKTQGGILMNSIVLAYSGGLDTSVILKWLVDTYHVPVFAYVANLGQDENLEEIRERAFATGARDVLVEDLVEPFVSEYVFAAVKANAVYEGYYLM